MLRPFVVCVVGGLFGIVVACGGGDPQTPSGGAGSSGSSGAGSSGGASGSSGGAGSSGASGAGSSGGESTFSTEQKQGIATFYDYSGGSAVACSFDITSDTDVTAIDPGEYAEAAACGSCVDVSGPKGKITVRIVDLCPGCENGHLDLSAEAFATIADPEAGRVPITYRVVACAGAGKMSYRFKDGSSKYWTAIQVLGHRLPITKLEYRKNGAYVDMPRADYNYFIDPAGVGDQPDGIAIRITAVDGQTVEDTLPASYDTNEIPGAVQFQ